MAKKNYKKSRRYKKMRRRKIIFGMEIAVLLILSGILFVYAWINRSMDKMNQDTLDTSQIQINSEVKANTDLSQLSGTQVIALVGVDARGVKGREVLFKPSRMDFKDLYDDLHRITPATG